MAPPFKYLTDEARLEARRKSRLEYAKRKPEMARKASKKYYEANKEKISAKKKDKRKRAQGISY